MRMNNDKQLSGTGGGFFSYYMSLCYVNTLNGISYIDELSISILLSLDVWFLLKQT
jgi:hypothetical protein